MAGGDGALVVREQPHLGLPGQGSVIEGAAPLGVLVRSIRREERAPHLRQISHVLDALLVRGATGLDQADGRRHCLIER